MPSQKDLAAALLQEHAVRAEALERARREHERTGRPLWAVITESGLCSEELLFRVLRRWGGVAMVAEERLRGLLVPAELRGILPRETASELGVLPLERSADGKRVALAMVDPMAELPTLQAALSRAGVLEIHRFLIHGAVLRRSLLSVYAEPSSRERPTLRLGSDSEVPLSDRPTGMVTLPEHAPPSSQAATQVVRRGHRQGASRPAASSAGWGISIFSRSKRNDEKTERLPGRGEQAHRGVSDKVRPRRGDGPLLSPPVQPFPLARARTTEPMPAVPPKDAEDERPATVQIDPQLAAEIEMLVGDVAGMAQPAPAPVPAPPKAPAPEAPLQALPGLDDEDESGPHPVPQRLPSSRSSPREAEQVTQVTRAPAPPSSQSQPALPPAPAPALLPPASSGSPPAAPPRTGDATQLGWPLPPVAPRQEGPDTPLISPVATLRMAAAAPATAESLTQALLRTVEEHLRRPAPPLVHHIVESAAQELLQLLPEGEDERTDQPGVSAALAGTSDETSGAPSHDGADQDRTSELDLEQLMPAAAAVGTEHSDPELEVLDVPEIEMTDLSDEGLEIYHAHGHAEEKGH